MNKKEYKIKDKHMIKLNKLYEEVKKEEVKEVTFATLQKSDKKEK